MELRYLSYDNLPAEPVASSLLALLVEVFANQSQGEFLEQLQYQQVRTGLSLELAVSGERVVGCKLGYERQPGEFYSWLGCVHSDFRGQRIASELMKRQHEWCRQRGYQTIRTQTYNQWRSMLILNLKHGFDIVGTVQGKRGLTIVLEKKL
ncbi:hypothetical protein GCM10027592_22680 [Spirosoma flavus]